MATPDDKFYRAKITERVDITPDLWRIRIDPGGEFRFQPGQYATLGVEGRERRCERPYSIVSSPYESEIEFFFELVPQGILTPELHKLNTGSELLMRKSAKGRFTLDLSGARKNHLLVSTVTGVAPFTSYIRTLSRDYQEGRFPEGHRLFLINGASRSWEFGYHDEIRDVAARSMWLQYVATISRPWEDPDWTGEVGRVDDILRKHTDQWRLSGDDTIAYLCGHPEMIEHGKGILQRLAFPKEALREEIYWVPAKEAARKAAQSA
ncbi:MAG: ferredoxin--NADP reductase [Acidobacteria bacterium]|nr:ferredoxin--NADP reductase [Acidobacteriota bacterium]